MKKHISSLILSIMVFVSVGATHSANANEIDLGAVQSIIENAKDDLETASMYADTRTFAINSRETDRKLCSAIGAFQGRADTLSELLKYSVTRKAFDLAIELYRDASKMNLYCSALNSYNGNRSQMQTALKKSHISLQALVDNLK